MPGSALADHACHDGQGWTAYSYPYYEGREYNLPECRLAVARRQDGVKGSDPNMRYGLNELNVNGSYPGRRIWPLLDSFQRTIIWIEQTSTQWVLRNSPSGNPVKAWTRGSQKSLVVQGKGCMDDPSYNDSRVVIAFEPPDFDASWRVRGNVLASAIPSYVVDENGDGPRDGVYSTGCGSVPAAGGTTYELGSWAEFAPAETFVGEDGGARSYYTWNPRPNIGNAMYVAYNTTAIRAGGTVRAVVKARRYSSGALADTAQIMDYFGYCDPNVPAGATRPMGWWYSNIHRDNSSAVSRISGWVPVRAC